MKKLLLFSAIILAGLVACKNGEEEPEVKPAVLPTIGHSFMNTYPHDTSSFTEGLLIYKGVLYESTGLNGRSRIMKIDLKTGKILDSMALDPKYFGEGIVILNDTIYQLTYQDKIGFMYSLKGFKKIGEFKFSAEEGWGMTTDGKQIIASDGTSFLYYYEPGSFRLLKKQTITEGGRPISNLNELEYIEGYVYANQWQYPYILKIDPNSGEVVARIDLTEKCNEIRAKDPHAEFLNGIAYDTAGKKMYVTGKLWPELLEIQLSK